MYDLKPLDKDVPNKKYYLRARDPLLEVRAPMKYKSKDRFERIKNACAHNPRVNLEHINTKYLFFHDHKPTNKKKFLTR